jgi:TatD DNase family protein
MSKIPDRVPLEPIKNLPIIDGHCHIPWNTPPPKGLLSYEDQYSLFFDENGQYLITCSTDVETFEILKAFVLTHPNMGFTAGWAPQNEVYLKPQDHDQQFEKWLNYVISDPSSYLGIGEIGLDFHHAKALNQRNEQIKYFRIILQKTKHLNKPYILHVRNAGESDQDLANPSHEYNAFDGANHAIWNILNEEKIPSVNVIWHCYSGPKSWSKRLLDAGCYLSVPTSAYGKNKWRKLIENAPIDQLLTETDSPYQHPYLFRPINEPALVKYAVTTIAYVLNLPQSEVAQHIIANFERVYKIKMKKVETN